MCYLFVDVHSYLKTNGAHDSPRSFFLYGLLSARVEIRAAFNGEGALFKGDHHIPAP